MDEEIAQHHRAALREAVSGAREVALKRGYEIGRRALELGLGLTDLVNIHHCNVLEMLSASGGYAESVLIVEHGAELLGESLSPFEMAQRGYRDANETLRTVNDVLEWRAAELSAANERLTREVHERRRVEEEQRAVLSSIGDGVVTTNGEGAIVLVNRGMVRLAGWCQEEVSGRPHADVFQFWGPDGQPLPQEQTFIVRALESRRVASTRGFGWSLLTRRGDRVPVSVTAAPVLDRGRTLLGAVQIVRDVSPEKEVDQLKSSIVSTVSHELRTPLTMIQGFAELLVARDFSDEHRREALGEIKSSAERLGRLVDDLLSVSRIESGRHVVRLAPVDLTPLVKEVIPPLASPREVRIDVVEPLPPIMADRDMVVRILTNLISNAIKYSPPDTEINMAVRQDGSEVEVAVTDHGIGMTEAELAELFTKFFRADRPEVRAVAGTGLGLYITRRLVELQGGQLRVESQLGRATTFSFTLPLAANEPV
ncbi:MAG: ATP-binding protein [Actinomycetota bacterium]